MMSDDTLTIDELRLVTAWFWPTLGSNKSSQRSFISFQTRKDVCLFWRLAGETPAFTVCGIDLETSMGIRTLRDIKANFGSMTVNRLSGLCLAYFSIEDEAMLKLVFAP